MPQGLVEKLDTHVQLFIPASSLHAGVGLGYLARKGTHHGDGVFGGGYGVAARSIHDHNTPAGGLGDVHIIDAYTCASDHLEPGSSFEDLSGDFCSATDRKTIVLPDDLLELFGGKSGFNVHRQARGAL